MIRMVKPILLKVSGVFCLTSYASLTQIQQRTSIAVIQLDCYGLNQGQAVTLSDAAASSRIQVDFACWSPKRWKRMLGNQGFQQSGSTSDECMVEVGRLVPVDKIMGASVAKH